MSRNSVSEGVLLPQILSSGNQNAEAERQHATAGRFGAHDVTDGDEDESANAEAAKLTPKVSRHGKDASNPVRLILKAHTYANHMSADHYFRL